MDGNEEGDFPEIDPCIGKLMMQSSTDRFD